ncbi:MAG: protein kinase, partial [Planctomycetota bacterium]|nr:protein kinase [Planctomycetota bacterium]
MSSPAVPERFEVLETLSTTDAVVLLRARDSLLDREVVLKLPGEGMKGHPSAEGRVLREAKSLASVQHPSIARLLDVLDVAGGPVLVIEPVAGTSLARTVSAEGRMNPQILCTIAVEMADALAAVHGIGVVHRDLSAENIVLRPEGGACLTGFAFAKPDRSGMTSINYARKPKADDPPVALPAHPAPEQLAGRVADARSDVYAFGKVMFEALVGESAEEGQSNPREVCREVPSALASVVRKCLAESPMERFQTAASLRDALERCQPGDSKRFPAWPAVAVAVLVLGAVFAMWQGSSGPEPYNPDYNLRGRFSKRLFARQDSPYSAKYEQSHALIIGIDYKETSWPPLPNARKDAQDLAKQLEAMPWEKWKVTLLVDAEETTRDRIMREVAKLKNSVDNEEVGTKPNDRIFIYYAGHGEDAENGFLIPSDAVPVSRDFSRKNWVRFTELHYLFDYTKAKHVLVAVDCCH